MVPTIDGVLAKSFDLYNRCYAAFTLFSLQTATLLFYYY